MSNDIDGVWIEDFLVDSDIDIELKDSEKLWREIYTLADDLFLTVIYTKYPLVSNKQQHNISIYKSKNKVPVQVFEVQGMELKPVLKKANTFLKKYKEDRREYIVQKPYGGEFI